MEEQLDINTSDVRDVDDEDDDKRFNSLDEKVWKGNYSTFSRKVTKLSRENTELSEKSFSRYLRNDVKKYKALLPKKYKNLLILSNSIEERGTKSKKLMETANRIYKWCLERRERINTVADFESPEDMNFSNNIFHLCSVGSFAN